MQAAQETLDARTKNLNLDRSDISVRKEEEYTTLKYRGIQRKKQMGIRKNTLIKIKQRLEILINNLTKTTRDLQIRGGSIEKLQEVQKHKIDAINIAKEIKVILQSLEDESGFKVVTFRTSEGLNPLGYALEGYNYLAKKYGTLSKQESGTFGEYFGAYGALISAKNIAYQGNTMMQNLQKQLHKSVIGSKGSKTTIQISSEYVDSDSLVNQMNLSSSGKNTGTWEYKDGVIVTTNESQDTVDISVDFEDTNNIFQSNQVNISFKNYQDILSNPNYSGVSVLSGMPLLSIFTLTGTNFANHYLNYIVQDGEGKSFTTLDNQGLDDTMKYAIAVRALSGARSQNFSKLSHYFMINIRAQNRIRVFSTTNLLNTLCNSFNNFRGDLFIINNLPREASIENIWDKESYKGRITNILARVAKIKLRASLSPKVFNELK